MKKAQLQITIINAVIASLSTLNIKQEGIICIQSNIIILLVLTFVRQWNAKTLRLTFYFTEHEGLMC
jgi:hypothetical protein